MQPIHARMPVILEQNEVRVWIEREGNLDDLLRLLQTP
jgi:putative SOS response-associated peptidase YedK